MWVESDLSYAGVSVVTVLSAGVGAFIGTYLKKKAENLATHEDFDQMVAQMAAITERTKSIEATISGEMWDKQKQWEMKREVLFEAAKRVAEVDDALRNYGAICKLSEEQVGVVTPEKFKEVSERWFKASAAMSETLLLVAVVCEKETVDACNAFNSVALNIALKAAKREPDRLVELRSAFHLSFFAARNSIRKELGVSVLPASLPVCP